jgi:hypothetical protein
MIPWWWSWLLMIVGVLGLWMAGSKLALGWLIGLGAQALWIGYGATTGQWGFVASALVYASVYARNWTRWRNRTEEQVR